MMRLWIYCVAFTATSLLAAGALRAATAYDGFTYTNGILTGRNGGTGWDTGSSWTQSNSTKPVVVSNTDLSSVGWVDPTAKSVQFVGLSNDTALTRSIVPTTASQPAYFSFLFEQPTADDNMFAQMQLTGPTSGNTANSFSIVVSNESLQARVGSSGTGTTSTITTLTAGQTYLLIGRVSDSVSSGDGAGELDTIQVWVYAAGDTVPELQPLANGSASSLTPSIGSLTKFNVRTANFDVTTESFWLDEVRVSDTWTGVIPEPSSAALVALVLVPLLGRRSRRTR